MNHARIVGGLLLVVNLYLTSCDCENDYRPYAEVYFNSESSLETPNRVEASFLNIQNINGNGVVLPLNLNSNRAEYIFHYASMQPADTLRLTYQIDASLEDSEGCGYYLWVDETTVAYSYGTRNNDEVFVRIKNR